MESSAGPVAPLEGSPDLPSRKNLSAIQGARDDQGQDSQKLRAVSSSKEHHTKKESTPISSEKLKDQKSQNIQPTKPLKSMIDFPFDEIFFKWYREKNDNVFRITIADLGIKGSEAFIDGLVKLLTIAADILRELNARPYDKKEYYEYLTIQYNSYFQNNSDPEKPSIYKFDNFLYYWGKKIWPRALDIIRKRCRR